MTNPTVSLNGETIELVCTLGAARAVSAIASALQITAGPRQLSSLALSGDIRALAIALSAVTGKRQDQLEEKIFAAGVDYGDLCLPVAEFYIRLTTGGKPLAGGEVSDEPADPPKAS